MAGEPQATDSEPIDLVSLAQAATETGAIWTRQSDDLNVNLVRFGPDGGVGAHVNDEVDVLLVGIWGEARIEIAGANHPLRAGQSVLVPKGVLRAIRGTGQAFAYLTCHRRRAGLWPVGVPRR